MILCDICLKYEALVVVEGSFYCPDCYTSFAPLYLPPKILLAQPIERRKIARGVLPETAFGLLPEDYDEPHVPTADE